MSVPGESQMSGVHVLTCIVVTPEMTVRECPAQFVVVPLYDGELGVAPGHSPMIGRLGFGEMRISEGDRVDRYYVDGGFVQVSGNIVSVLTNRAVPSQKIDPAAAAEQLAAARRRVANTPELLAIRERAEQQARALVRVASRA